MHNSPARKDRDRNSGFLTPLLYLDFLGGIKGSQMIPPYAMWCAPTTSTTQSFGPGFFFSLFLMYDFTTLDDGSNHHLTSLELRPFHER